MLSVCLFVLLLITTPSFVDPDTTSSSLYERPTIRAERITSDERPVIDGSLADAVWQQAPRSGNFVQVRPEPGVAETERTEVAFLYDDDAVYVAVWMYDSEPEKIMRRAGRRDTSPLSDRVFIGLDTFGDGQTAFGFIVNAAGVKLDFVFFNDTNEDTTWDAIWEASVGDLPEGGWSVEYRIPLSQLRYPSTSAPQNWRLQVQRIIPRKDEETFWAPMLPEMSGFVSRFGYIEGVEGLTQKHGLELMPYVASSLERSPGEIANPFYSTNDLGGSIGLDIRYSLSSNLTLNATVNPDFGQVEADPATVNLTAFETFFSERRPFFVEGTDVFQFGRTRTYSVSNRPTLFYSRRIGQSPRGRVSDAEYTDIPTQTPILGAAKISGRVGHWSMGVLNATTAQSRARYIDSDGNEGSAIVEPLTNYLVGRVQRDFREGATVVGLLGTSTLRHTPDEDLQSMAADQALIGGIDFQHAWDDRGWILSGVFATSSISGSPEYVSRLQRAAQRYFNRPDADHLEHDPTRTHLAGTYTELSLARMSGRLRGSVTANAVSAGFDTNDLGFQTRADAYSLNALMSYREPNSSISWIQRWNSSIGWVGVMNGGGNIIENRIFGEVSASLPNQWSGGLYVTAAPTVADDRLTRGGPLARRPGYFVLNSWMNTDSRKSVSVNPWVYHRRSFDGSGITDYSGGFYVSIRPSTHLSLGIGPEYLHMQRTDQYITSITDESATATFGRRYVFAHMNQHQFSMTFRADWIFTPDLTLQLYAQPFISSASFSRFNEFTTPGEHRFTEYGQDRGSIDFVDNRYVITPETGASSFTIDNPDFAVRSMRFNAVLRWEYRPGSTLFVVWQQERSGFEETGSFDLGPNTSRLFTDEVANVFMVKLSYWLGM